MSLTRFAVRICTARALLGATLAEDRVFQSAIDPLDTKVSSTTAPMLIVNTDDHKMEVEGRDLTGGEERLDLVIESAIAAKVVTEGKNGEGAVVDVDIPHTDSGMDLTLDILEHQTIRALLRGRTVWAALWCRFVLRVISRQSRRGADTSGVRYAARQTVLVCDTVADPVGGESLAAGTIWGDLLAAMDADAGLAPVVPLLRAVIIGDGQNPDWERVTAMIGASAEVAEALGYYPSVFDDGEPVRLDGIDLVSGEPD